MIEISVLVSNHEVPELYSMVGDTFIILDDYFRSSNGTRFFTIKTTEEDYTILTLKYGRMSVWRR
jgi:hypothetical protein